MTKSELIAQIVAELTEKLTSEQREYLQAIMYVKMQEVEIVAKETAVAVVQDSNESILKRYTVDLLAGDRKKSTVKSYVTHLKLFFEETGMYYKNVTTQDIVDYMAWRKVTPTKTGKECSPNYLVMFNKILRAFFQWAYRKHHIDTDVVRDIEPLRQKPKRKERLSNEEVEKIRDELTGDRDKALFELMISTGLRVGEIERLRIEDIDFETRDIHVRGYKTAEADRICPMSIRAKHAILRYIGDRTEGMVFISKKGHEGIKRNAIERDAKRFGEQAGVKLKTTVHIYRKTFASELYRKTGNVKVVSKMLGHANTAVTERFYLVDDVAEMLRIARAA